MSILSLFEKLAFWVIFGIFCIFWKFWTQIPKKLSVQFSTFSKISIFEKNAKNGHFWGWVRGPPYSFCRFLAIFDTSATQNDRFFSRFFTFFNYPSSPGAIRPWAWRKWHFLKMPKKRSIFWKCTFCHFWPFWQILADFGSFLDLLISCSFLKWHFTGAILRSVEKTRFFLKKTRFFFAFFVIFWPFFVIFLPKKRDCFSPFFAIFTPFLAYFSKVPILKRGRYRFICVIFIITLFATFLSLFCHFYSTFLSLFWSFWPFF